MSSAPLTTLRGARATVLGPCPQVDLVHLDPLRGEMDPGNICEGCLLMLTSRLVGESPDRVGPAFTCGAHLLTGRVAYELKAPMNV